MTNGNKKQEKRDFEIFINKKSRVMLDLRGISK